MPGRWTRGLGAALLVAGIVLGPRVFGAGGSPQPAPAGWTIADLGDGAATAVNGSGQIIGNGCTAECPDWAVTWRNGKMTALVPHPTRDGAGSTAAAISEHGQIVGWTFTDSCNPADDRDHAFLWQNGKTTFLRAFPGGDTTEASAINESGQAVGWSETNTGARHAALWQAGGQARDLGTLGGKASAALGINEHSQVAGWSETKTGERHAFLWQGGTMRDLGTLGGRGSEAVGINDNGQIIGISFPTIATWGAPVGPVHGFLWENGKMTDLGQVASAAWQIAINSRGQVAGSRETGSLGTAAPPNAARQRAFLWANGRMSYLPTPRGASGSTAYAINDHGQVVGTCEFPGGSHGCLWQGGKVVDLGFLGPDDHRGTSAIGRSINQHGQIVGNSQHFMDFSHAVLWTQAHAS